MSKIFLSYSRTSKEIIKNLEEDFEALGHTVWYDKQISGGQEWWDQILEQIRKCDLLAIVIDSDSLISAACESEYTYAINVGKPVLPILVSRDISPNLLPPALTKIQLVEYQTTDRKSAFQLSNALSNIPAADDLPETLPEKPSVPMSYLSNLAEKVYSKETMSFEEQGSLIVELKRGLKDPKNSKDSLKLLQNLRQRRDLFTTVSDEIDILLKEQPDSVPGPGMDKPKPRPTEYQQTQARSSDYAQPIVQQPMDDSNWSQSIFIILVVCTLVMPLIGFGAGIYGLFTKKNKTQSAGLIIFSLIMGIIWQSFYAGVY